jgi:predicted nucleic acid-binding protein
MVVSALRNKSSEGTTFAVLETAFEAGYEPLYTDSIMQEYHDVLSRSVLGIDEKDLSDFLYSLEGHGSKLYVLPSDIKLPDESDRPFFDLAKSTGAYLVTGNIKHYPDEPYIVTPARFLEIVDYAALFRSTL